MLNPFPQLFVWSFFVPTMLRIAAALVMFCLAYHHFKRKDVISRERFPVIGANGWVAWFSIVVEIVVGLTLLFGYGTQVAALITALIGLKASIWAGKYPAYFVLSRTAALLLLVIALSLLVTGAGAFAMDLPL